MNIGILGIGVIGSALVKGFTKSGLHHIYISPRSEETSKELEKNYTNVKRCLDNQELVDQSDFVFVSILPQHGLTVLSGLKFHSRHRIINLMSDKSLEEIKEVVGQVKSISHLVPLSFVSNKHGPIGLYPQVDEIEELMSELGQVVSVDKVEKIKAIAAITGLMTSYYQMLDQLVTWGECNGLSHEESLSYTTHFFEALSKHARKDNLKILSTEMTPGGLNEQALFHLKDEKAFKPWIDILDPILKRLE